MLPNTVPLGVGYESSCISTATEIMYSGLGGSICIHYAAVRNQVMILRLTCPAKAKLLALVTKVGDSVSRNAVLVKHLVGY